VKDVSLSAHAFAGQGQGDATLSGDALGPAGEVPVGQVAAGAIGIVIGPNMVVGAAKLGRDLRNKMNIFIESKM